MFRVTTLTTQKERAGMGCCADGTRPGAPLLFRSSPAPLGSRSFPPLEVLSCSSVAPRPSCELRQHGVNKTASPPIQHVVVCLLRGGTVELSTALTEELVSVTHSPALAASRARFPAVIVRSQPSHHSPIFSCNPSPSSSNSRIATSCTLLPST